jgi:nitrogen fixation protein NifU and related proteins
MLSDLDDLYQQVILDHGRKPRNFHALENPDAHADGYNPLCGDRVTVYIKRDDEHIADATFTGKGCAICTASASMMTQALKGRGVDDAGRLFDEFHRMLTDESFTPDRAEALGKLAVFAGVKKYPIRVKCATLPWHTFKAALDRRDKPVSTE